MRVSPNHPAGTALCYICGLPFAGHGAGGPAHPAQFGPIYAMPATFDTTRAPHGEPAWSDAEAAALLAQQQWQQAAMYVADDQSIRAATTLLHCSPGRSDDLLAFGLMCVAAYRRLTSS